MHFDRLHSAGRRALVALTILTAAALLPGCGKGASPVAPPVQHLGHVTITPSADSLVVGGTRQFVAVAYDTSGAVSSAAVTWKTLQSAVCTVSSTGLASAKGEGVGQIVATAGDRSDTATVYVTGSTSGWIAQTSGTTRNLNGVYFQADGRTGYAVGELGTLLLTTDAGATWTPGTSGTAEALQSVWFTSSTTGWTAGAAGALMKTTNGGTSWTRQTQINVTTDLQCVRFADARHGWVVGANGLVARTVDGGTTWSHVNLFATTLHAVAFTDTLNGWVAGVNGKMLATHDGGASWFDVSLPISSQTLKSAWAGSRRLAVAVGTSGTVARSYRTADSLAWTNASVGANYTLNGVAMADTLLGWAVGGNAGTGAVLVTTDAGQSWATQSANSAQVLNGVYFCDRQRGWAVGNTGRILHTTHAGNL